MEKKIDAPGVPNPDVKVPVFKAGIIDVQALVEAQAQDIGEARMTESKEDKSKNWLSRNATRIWKHNLAQEYYRHKEISKVREKILRTGNLYDDEKEFGADGDSKKHHDEAMGAVIAKFTSEYADEVLRKEEKGEKITLIMMIILL